MESQVPTVVVLENCPLCFKRFPISEIERHADICTGDVPMEEDIGIVQTSPNNNSNVMYRMGGNENSIGNGPGGHGIANVISCTRLKCLDQERELEEYRNIFEQLLAYINLRDKVKLSTIEEVREHIERNSVVGNKCFVCDLVIENDKDFERHLNECIDLADNNSIKNQLSALMHSTLRSKAEVFLVARHYDLLNKPQYEEALKILKDGFDLEAWKTKRKEIVLTKDCNICFDTFPITEMFTLDCPSSHRYCRECMHQQLLTDLKDKRVSFCPTPGCKHQITETEVKQLFGSGRELDEYEDVLLQKELAKLPVVGCPTPGCKNFIEIHNSNIPVHCACTCGASFCSMCRHEYHFRSSCQEALKLTALWINWNQQGRDTYHSQLQAEQKMIEGYDKERKRVEARNEELKQRYDDLLRDEQWKEQNCHACPSCGRPIQKLEGCDSMVCGSDYHGGNVQNGCGTRFAWSQSQPYKSQGLQGPSQEELKAKPIPINKINHGDWRPCDYCRKTILGLRFSCIHCASFNLCENCEFKVDHDKKHVFKVFQTKEEEIVEKPKIPSRVNNPIIERITAKFSNK